MRRIALLIGNDEYDDPNRKLSCAVNDADALSAKLSKLNFDTFIQRNVSTKEFSDAMVDFSRKLEDYDVGLFFFAGHGFQVEGNNYLGCTDTSFVDDISMRHTAYELKNVLDDMQNSNLQIKILIIDACRSYAGTRGGYDGFAPVFAPKGTIIAFATSPGQTAKEKNGHGIFTKAILQHISSRNISIEEMFKRVRNNVYMESSGSQITWEHTSLMGKFTFNDSEIIIPKFAYSQIALADANYEPVSNGKCYELIQDAKTLNYNYQNTIPSNMASWLEKLYNEDPDDIFVLGRNLYQAAENAFSISNYFDQLSANLSRYRKDFANHLLSGMAFEIYFGSDGRLRKCFKTNRYYTNVLVLLMTDQYIESKNFLISQLKGYSQQVMYIPGDTMNLTVVLKLVKCQYSDDYEYCIEQLLLDGMNVIYNSEGSEPYDTENDYMKTIDDTMEVLNSRILASIAGTRRGVNIEYISNDESTIKPGVPFSIPGNYSLLRYSN